MTRARDNANLSPTIADARMPNLTGDITTVEGAVATTIADDAVTGAKIENNPTIAGNLTVSGDIVPSTPMSHRNMIINGGMQVAQRGTVTVTGSSYGGPDRFTSFISAAGTWEQSQHNMTSAELNTTGFSSAYKMKCTVANASIGAAGYAILGQRLEAQNLQHLKWGTASAKDMTLSFWVRSAKTGTHVIQLFHDEATGYNSIAYTIAVADTWEYKTMTFSGHPSIAIDNNNGTGFRVYFWLDAGSNLTSGTLTNNTWHTTVANRAAGQATLADTVNNEFYITGVQLELGSSATPFEHRSYGDELARCHRYYQVLQASITWGNGFGRIRSYTDRILNMINLHTEMRVLPHTITWPVIGQGSGEVTFLNGEGYPTTHGSVTSVWATPTQVGISVDGFSSVGAAGLTTWAYTTGIAYFRFSAEL